MLKPEHPMRPSLILSLLVGLGLTSVHLEAQLFSLSEPQEIELGREASKKVETDMPMLRDSEITAYVNRLGQNLVRYSHRSNLRYSFKVVNSPEINAFALPGGFIYVNRGLLEAADNESEVAGVLGHEISHVVARHSADQMKKSGHRQSHSGRLGSCSGRQRWSRSWDNESGRRAWN